MAFKKQHKASVLEDPYLAGTWMKRDSVHSHVPVTLRHQFYESIMDFDCSLLDRK